MIAKKHCEFCEAIEEQKCVFLETIEERNNECHETTLDKKSLISSNDHEKMANFIKWSLS